MSIFSGALTSQAGTVIWNGNVSRNWADPNNFQASGSNLPGVPQPGDTVFEESWATQTPLLATNDYAFLNDVYFSNDLTITNGGELDTVYFKLGWDASATLNVDGGTLSAVNHLDVGGYNGGTATFNLSGGAVNVGGLYLNLNGTNTGSSFLNLNGGTLTLQGPLSIKSTHPAIVNLAGGSLVIPGSNAGNINYWINAGNIVAYSGSGTVNVDSSSSPGNIILTGIASTVWFWNGDVSQDWTNPNNFQSSGANGPGLPMAGNTVYLESWAVREPYIANNNNAPLNAVYQSKNMTLGTGGALDAASFTAGQDATATLSMNGGTLVASNSLDVGGYNGGTATLNVSNGLVNVGSFYLNLQGDGTSVGGSQVLMSGGTIQEIATFSINETHPALFNMLGGQFVVPNYMLGNVSFWINDGSIAAYGIGGTTNNFNFDQVGNPGNTIVTPIYPGVTGSTFPQWNPQVLAKLPGLLDQSMPLVPAGLAIVTAANYGFGTAVGTSGMVYFSEAGAPDIKEYNPADGSVSVVVANLPGIYGVAVDQLGNLFYALDSDAGNGSVVKRASDGSKQIIMTGLTRPRQLATDAAGNLYVAMESSDVILKWDHNSSAVSTVVNTPGTPGGVAVAPDGRIYFSCYGKGSATGTYLTQGTVWVLQTNGAVNLLATGLARTRGLALHPNGSLYAVTEANVWDQGNSGEIVQIATNGTVTPVLAGVDYAQFPAIGTNGILYVTAARDGKLLSFDPAKIFTAQTSPLAGVTLIASGGEWQSSGGSYPMKLHLTDTNNPADNLTIPGYLAVSPGSGAVDMWFNVPVTNLNVSLAQIPNSSGNTNSGIFQLPAATVDWAYGPVSASVIPLREHQRSRWPMTNTGNPALEAPAPDFAEAPTSYLVYVSVVTPPVLKIQPWAGNQVRISWPASATGYTLQSSTTVNTGYIAAGLSVHVEGGDNAAYDTVGTAARFYRLTK